MKIERIETAYYRLPLEPMGDAGHGAIDTEELVTLTLHAEGLEGHGYSYTIGRGGRAVRALIEEDIAPLHVALPSCSRRALSVFEELGGVGTGEQVDHPVGEHLRPVEVVAELIEVNAFPD